MTAIHSSSQDERKYHDTKAAYSLPNDTPEHERLESQADYLSETMNNEIFHAPLAPTIHKVLDMGCGTGTVTHTAASKFPNTQVYGLDLSPVPQIRRKLPNIEYVQGDLFELTDADESDPRFGRGSFDYIFSRLLIAGMTDWKAYVDRCVALTKPGGWVEMHDLVMQKYCVPQPMTPSTRALLSPHFLTLDELQAGSHPTETWLVPCNWMTMYNKLSDIKGMDGRCGRRLPGLFVDAGLQDVQIKQYMYPFSTFDGMTEFETKFGLYHRENMGKHVPDLIRKLAQGQNVVSHEEVENACEEVKKDNENGEGFVWLYVVFGRKAPS